VIYYETTQVGWSWDLDEQSSELNLNPEDWHIQRPLGGQFFQSEKTFVFETPTIDVDVPTSCDILRWSVQGFLREDLAADCEQDARMLDPMNTIITGIALSNNSSVNITSIKIKFERYELTKAEPMTFQGVSDFYSKLATLQSEEVVFELPMIPNQGNSTFNQIYVPMFWYYETTDNIVLSEIYVPKTVEFYHSQTQKTENQDLRLMYGNAMSINTFVDGRG
jgi:hypothetical protein